MHASTFDADALAGHALSLAGDDAAIAGLRAAAANLKLRNGVDIATDALDALLARRLALSPPPP